MVSCKRNKVFIAPIGMVGLTILSGAFLISSKVNADDSSVSTATITVPVSCSLIGVTNTAHTAEIPNGIDSRGSDYYPNGIGQTTLKAYCNDNEGFSIYAVGYTGDTIGNTYLRDNTLGQTDDIQTSTTFSGANSAWAMKLGATTGTYTPIITGSTADTERQSGDTDYSTWAVVPASYQRVAYRNSATDVDNGNIAAEGAQLTTTYAVYISPTQKAGTYIGKVKYTLVHPASEAPLQPQPSTAGCINYFANTSTAVGTMGCQSATNNANVTLLASNFSRTGYGFAGWSDTYDYATNNNAHFYGPQETIIAPVGTTANGLSLYAVWVKSEGSIQDASRVASICSRLTTAPTDGTANLASVSALTDQRDNNTYAIAKLADGNCWMIENLRLESANPDNSTGTLAQGYGISAIYGNFGGLADVESSGFSSAYSANSLYYCGSQSGTASIDIGCNYPGTRMPRYNNINTFARVSSQTTNWGSIYGYGNYYTWHAAMANTIHYYGPTITDADGKTSETVNTSLCPTGWRLPYGRDTGNGALSGGFYNLSYKTNNNSNVTDSTASQKFRSFPNNFLYSGGFSSSTANNRGYVGVYWSSTASSNSDSYALYLNSSSVDPGVGGYGKESGWSIRCVIGS